MSGKKLFLVVNVDWFFLSHRLPIALEAKRRGYDVTVLAIEEEGRGDEIRSHGLRFVPLPSSRGGKNLLDELRLIFFLRKIYKTERPDIVHHVAIKPVLYGSLVARFVKIPKIVNAVSGFGTAFINPNPLSPIFIFIKNLYKFSFRNPRLHVIVQNEDDVQQVRDFRALDERQIHLIKGSGVDLSDFAFSEEGKSPPVRVLLPARMLWDKGVGEFVEAARILKKRHGTAVEFILAGKTDPENATNISEEKLREWTAEGCVQWIGFQRDMVKICREAHVVCLPSYREGLPKSLIEAMAVGRPVVTTDVPGCRVVVEQGVNGFLVPVREVEPLAEALEKLILDKNLRLKMGLASRKMAENEFSIEMVLRRTFEIYERMKVEIYINDDCIGETKFKITDESMGGISGDFIPNESYKKYKTKIQTLTKEKGIANISDFNFRILIDNIKIYPAGGIGIIDSEEFDELIIESAGNDLEIIERIKKDSHR